MRIQEIANIHLRVGYEDSTGCIVLSADICGWTQGEGLRIATAEQLIPQVALIRSSEPIMEMAFNSVRTKCLQFLKSAQEHSSRQEMFKAMNQKPTQEP